LTARRGIVRRAIVAAIGAGVLLGASLSASVAAASGAAKSGKIELWVLPSPTGATSTTHPGKVIFTGAIGDYGEALKVNAAGKPTTKATYRLLKLKKGTILVDIAKFSAAERKLAPSIDLATCSFFGSVSGAISIVSGTGTYHGITGSVTLTALYGGIGPFKNGKCTTKTTTPALATYSSITGSGTVTLG
jgi:hypothetical protein